VGPRNCTSGDLGVFITVPVLRAARTAASILWLLCMVLSAIFEYLRHMYVVIAVDMLLLVGG